MKYILMMQFPLASWRTQRLDVWPKQDIKAHIGFMMRFNQELAAAGELVRTGRARRPRQTKIVRATQGRRAGVTDGPFPESKEFLAGFWIVDVETPQRAYRDRRAGVGRARAAAAADGHADRGARR